MNSRTAGATVPKKAGPDGDDAKAIVALTAERDQAVADLATRTGERDAALASVETVTHERDKAIEWRDQVRADRDAMAAEANAIGAQLAKLGMATPEGVSQLGHIGDLIVILANGRTAIGAALIAQGFISEAEVAEGQRVDIGQRAVALIAEFAGLKAGLAAIHDHIVTLELQPTDGDVPLLDVIDRLIARVPELSADLAAAQTDLAAATRAKDKAKVDLKAARASLAPKPAKLRAIGPIADAQPAGEALLKAIEDADTVELVFSDGARELGSMPPMLIQGNAWHLAVNGVKLRIGTLPVHGLGQGEPSIRLAGFGLLLDGKLAAYAPRMDVLELQPGSRHELKDDVIFA